MGLRNSHQRKDGWNPVDSGINRINTQQPSPGDLVTSDFATSHSLLRSQTVASLYFGTGSETWEPEQKGGWVRIGRQNRPEPCSYFLLGGSSHLVSGLQPWFYMG